MSQSRKKAALLSTIVGLANSVVTLLLTFVLRTVVLKRFSTEYVGLYTLLSQTIGVLVGIDAGLSSSIMIKIHKPIAEGNVKRIQHTYFLVRVIYYFRAALVLVFGAIIGFFIPRMITTSIDVSYIYCCYYTFLALNAISYLFIFDFFMLETVQKRYVASLVMGGTNVVVSIINLICIKNVDSFLLYLFISVFNTLAGYFICSKIFRKAYKGYYCRFKLDRSVFESFKELLGMAVHTLSNTVVKHSETIIMSIVTNLTVTGLYSNYHLLISGVNTLAVQLTSSVKDPFRNISVTATPEKANGYLKKVVFLYGVVMGAMCVTFCATADIFVYVFWGVENILEDKMTICLMAMSAYLFTLSGPLVDYYYCKELHREDRFSPVLEVVINLAVSLGLGAIIGINGILIGTILTYTYRIVHRTMVLKSKTQMNGFMEILSLGGKFVLLFFTLVLGMGVAVRVLVTSYTLISFMISAMCVFVVTFVLLCVAFYRSVEFDYYKQFFLESVNRIRKRKGKAE